MALKRIIDKSTEVFELIIEHSDIINMMNDPDVLIDDGNVSSSQILELAVRRINGSEIVLQKFNIDDVVVARFQKCASNDETTPLGDIDVKP